MSKLLIEYILRENTEEIVDINVVEKLAKSLTADHGIPRSQIRKIFKDAEDAGGSMNKAYPIAYRELLKLVPKGSSDSIEDIDGIDLIGTNIGGDTGIEQKDNNDLYSDVYSDEGFIDVLKYLTWLWKSKDRVRVLAKRFGVDPDLYAAAGLGNIPENSTDRDIWNTMDMSNKGEKEFVDSAWQPFYIDTLEKLTELPREVKDEITKVLEKANENVVQYESVKLVEDLMVLTEHGMEVIPSGTIFKLPVA